ncbi:hypothetical protein BDV98DRAFT_487591, partial [Pterulicium gracile]
GCARVPTLKTLLANGAVREYTTNLEKAELLVTNLFPAPPPTFVTPPVSYPDPIQFDETITHQQIIDTIRRLHAHKAPGPDVIPNVVLKMCADIIAPHLLHVYQASLTHGFYPEQWRESTTVIICKPDNESYEVMSSYRPIALLNTLGKLFTAIATDILRYLIEKHELL